MQQPTPHITSLPAPTSPVLSNPSCSTFSAQDNVSKFHQTQLSVTTGLAKSVLGAGSICATTKNPVNPVAEVLVPKFPKMENIKDEVNEIARPLGGINSRPLPPLPSPYYHGHPISSLQQLIVMQGYNSFVNQPLLNLFSGHLSPLPVTPELLNQFAAYHHCLPGNPPHFPAFNQYINNYEKSTTCSTVEMDPSAWDSHNLQMKQHSIILHLDTEHDSGNETMSPSSSTSGPHSRSNSFSMNSILRASDVASSQRIITTPAAEESSPSSSQVSLTQACIVRPIPVTPSAVDSKTSKGTGCTTPQVGAHGTAATVSNTVTPQATSAPQTANPLNVQGLLPAASIGFNDYCNTTGGSSGITYSFFFFSLSSVGFLILFKTAPLFSLIIYLNIQFTFT